MATRCEWCEDQYDADYSSATDPDRFCSDACEDEAHDDEGVEDDEDDE